MTLLMLWIAALKCLRLHAKNLFFCVRAGVDSVNLTNDILSQGASFNVVYGTTSPNPFISSQIFSI